MQSDVPAPPGAAPGDGTAPTALHALAYASTARRELSDPELERLMRPAQARNQANAITGMLLYSGGSFMQVLEGPEPAVRETYARIQASALHFGQFKLLDEPVLQREFGQWSMGYGRIQPPALALLSAASGSSLRGLMAGFWASNRR